MSQAVNTVAVKSTLSEPLAASRGKIARSAPAPAAAITPAAASAAAPSSITTIGQPVKPELGLFTKAGVVEKAPVLNTSTTAAKVAVSTPTPAPATAAGAATFVAGKGDVVVDIQNSDSGYDNKIYYSTDNFKTKTFIGIDNHTGTVNLGSFAEGTKIEFGIDNGVNQFYRTGAASVNSDNFQHAQVSKTADGIKIGFEDLAGGGDRDFNDAIISVRNTPPKAAAAVVPREPQTKISDNRSGLGDGTNPGQGAGRDNSPNQGTSNPSNTTLAAAVKSAASAVAVAAKPPVLIPLPPAAKAPEPAAAKPLVLATPVSAKTSASATSGPAPAPATTSALQEAVKALAATPQLVAPKPAIVPVIVAGPLTARPVTPASDKAPAAAPASPAAKAPLSAVVVASAKDNRSGLGDGSNPGQGAGRVNSPNVGTNNPANANTTVKPGIKI